MSLSFLTPSRTVLLISDEFLSIYTTGSKGGRLVDTVPWDTENFEDSVARTIVKDCGRKPILILGDMVEQHYRKERILKVGVNMMDKASMIKRKLNVAFPSYPVKAAYQLKEKIAKTGKQGAAEIYIFAAVGNSDQLTKTIGAARKSMASVAGFCLLPVESSDMVYAYSAKLPRKSKTRPVWSVFMGQHRNGNLRQIVTKNGDLALTRMSPIIDRDDSPEAWAAELYQELKATMSYLGRFGYEPSDGLDLIVVANPGAGEILAGMIEEDCTLHVMTAGEAASVLGLAAGRQENGRYADMLHVAWAARKSKFILPMKAMQIDEVSRPRQAAMAVAAVLMLGGAFLGYQTFSAGSELAQIYQEIADETSTKAQLDVQYQKEVQRLNELGFDVQLVQSSIEVNKQFEMDRIKALELVENTGAALGKDMRVDLVVLGRYESNPLEKVVNIGAAPPDYQLTLTMTYPSTADIEKGNAEVEALKARLEKALPERAVEITKKLKDYGYKEGIVVEAGDVKKQNIQQDYVAELVIKGSLPKPEKMAEAPEQAPPKGRRGRK